MHRLHVYAVSMLDVCAHKHTHTVTGSTNVHVACIHVLLEIVHISLFALHGDMQL